MLATLGDLIDDVVVRLDGPINTATDTPARITRRRGGSAANVAATAAQLGIPVRFIGQVGDDAVGAVLVGELDALGVDVLHVRRVGATGTIVVLVDERGERSMLTDRRTCADLDAPDPAWLDGVDVLHVPLYSLSGGATAATAATVIGWAHDRDIAVSIDLSSSSVLETLGVGVVRDLVTDLAPVVVFANADEAQALEVRDPLGRAITVVKRGAAPAIVHRPGEAPLECAALPLDGVADSTGAGDAFAAGFLATTAWLDDPLAACRAGHRAAHAHLTAQRERPVGGDLSAGV